jgi:cell division protein FtsA
MSVLETITAIDVGTTKICAIVSQIERDGRQSIVSFAQVPSAGLRKGAVVDVEKASKALQSCIDKLKETHTDFGRIVLGIAGGHIKSSNAQVQIELKNREITEEDLSSIRKFPFKIPEDHRLIQAVIQDYDVDDLHSVKNCIGMMGKFLTANFHIVSGNSWQIRNLEKCFENCDLEISDIVLQPIASSLAVLTEEEKDLGVLLVDIGGGTTDLAIWKDGCLIYSEVIPIGGNHFTSDLAHGLSVGLNEAEKIKTFYGKCFSVKDDEDKKIRVQQNNGKMIEVSATIINSIIQSRVDELLHLIKRILSTQRMGQYLRSGIVFTGGGSLMRGLGEYSELILDQEVRLGEVRQEIDHYQELSSVKYATLIGLNTYASQVFSKNKVKNKKDYFNAKMSYFKKLSINLKTFVDELF